MFLTSWEKSIKRENEIEILNRQMQKKGSLTGFKPSIFWLASATTCQSSAVLSKWCRFVHDLQRA